MNCKKPLVISVMTAILCLTIIVSLAYATQMETMTVDPSIARLFIINLDQGDKFKGSLSISGGGGNDINFWVTAPSGNIIVNLGRISQGTTFDFTAQDSGAYTLHFDNSFSILSSKTVTLSYDIESAVLISLIWIIIVVVVIGIVLIGIGIYVSLRRKNKTNV